MNSSMKKKVLGIGGSVAAAILLIAGFTLYVRSGDSAVPGDKGKKEASVPVVIASVEQMDVPISLSVVGKAEALSSVTVKPRVDGQIQAINFREGQYITKGQKLFQIDSRSFDAVLRQAEANLARDRVQLDKANNDINRYTELQQKGFISAEKLSEIKTNAAAIEANVKSDSAARDLAQLQLSHTNVVSPLSGYAGNLQVQIGSTIKANDTTLIVINQTNPIYATFSLPENKLMQIKQDMKKAPIKVTVTVPGNSQSIEGKLVFIDNTVDPTTGTIQMKALINNPANQLTPGQFVNISLVAQTLEKALVVPSQAVQSGPDGTFIFVIKEGKAEMRPVTVASTTNERAIMTTGLTPGEQVIIDGQSRVVPGGKVEAKQSNDKTEKNKSQKPEK